MEQDLQDDNVVLLDFISNPPQNIETEKVLAEPLNAKQMFQKIQYQIELEAQRKQQKNRKETDLSSKIIEALAKKLGKISYQKYDEYDKINRVIHSCQKQRHCRKKVFSTKKHDEIERSRVFSSKKRVQSAVNSQFRKEKKRRISTPLEKTAPTERKRKLGRFSSQTNLQSNNWTQLHSGIITPTANSLVSSRNGRKMSKKNKENVIMDRFKFENQLKGIIFSCDRQNQSSKKLKKGVNHFNYFCDKFHKNMAEKHDKFRKKVREQIINLYDD